METKKIGIACFIGTAVGTFLAFWFAPRVWWLGIPAGSGVGYFAYEFREVLRAIPSAWRAATNGLSEGAKGLLVAEKAVHEWAKEPHPVIYPGMFVGIAAYAALLYKDGRPFTIRPFNADYPWDTWGVIALDLAINAVFVAICMGIGAIPCAFLACIGSAMRKEAISYFDFNPFTEEGRSLEAQIVEPTYRRLLLWMVTPLWFCTLPLVKLIVWDFLLVCGVRFGKFLFIQIHSHKRVLCGSNAAFGVTMGYLFFGEYAQTGFEAVFLSLASGFIGAALGVVSWHVISIRILRVPASS